MTEAYFQMAGALVFVILLILGVALILKRRQDRLGFMNIIGYQSFGPKKGVAALKIGKEILILGITPNEMRLLRVFKDSELDMSSAETFHGKLERFKKINNLTGKRLKVEK